MYEPFIRSDSPNMFEYALAFIGFVLLVIAVSGIWL